MSGILIGACLWAICVDRVGQERKKPWGLMVGLVFCVLFALSRWWEFGYESKRFGASCSSGWLVFSSLSFQARSSGAVYPAWRRDAWFWRKNTSVVLIAYAALPFLHIRPSGYHTLKVPLAWVALLAAVPSTLRYFRRNPRLRLCRHCAYDLTGNTSGVCPECGTQT
jgi:hypothetical protein